MKNLKSWLNKNRLILLGGGLGILIGLILVISNLYNLLPPGLDIIYYFPGTLFIALVWIPLIFFGIDLGPTENPYTSILIVGYIFFILFYFIVGVIITLVIQKFVKFIKK